MESSPSAKLKIFTIRLFTESLLILAFDHAQKAISHPKTACENPDLLLRNNHFKLGKQCSGSRFPSPTHG